MFVSFDGFLFFPHPQRRSSLKRDASPKSHAGVLLSARFRFRTIFGEVAFAGY